ncbi:MAG: hypothetical protein GXO54_05120 [Chloroflexi bacterium]|nr:hypothetical protein [Chloroflexota bacterium]
MKDDFFESQHQADSMVERLHEWQEWAVKELERTRSKIRELALTAEKVKDESERLGQQSAAIINYLRQAVQRRQWQDLARGYNTALETQRRYLLLRAQAERLEAQKDAAQAYLDLLERFLEVVNFALEQVGSPQAAQTAGRSSSVELVKMVIQAEERVRQRLARQIHDGPAQALSNFILQADIIRRLFENDPQAVHKEMEALQQAANKTFQDVRAFIAELRPLSLDDLGLVAGLQRYLNMVQKRFKVQTDLKVQGQARKLEPYLEMLIFRAVQELTSRAVEGQASRVEVLVDYQAPDQIFLRVEHDSRKWSPTSELGREDSDEGLRLLEEQIAILGGAVTAEPLSYGDGEYIEISIPTPQGG